MVHRDNRDMSIREVPLPVRLIIINRPVEDSGWTTNGGFDEACGSCGVMVSRSCTTCRAWIGLVPGSKVISIELSPGIVRDSSLASQGIPLKNSFSMGFVMRFSTSSAERPRASTCTSTRTGPNSGSASTAVLRSWMKPKTINASATPSTRRRYFWLDPTIHRMAKTPCRNRGAGRQHRRRQR
jgi:hypothetical protein